VPPVPEGSRIAFANDSSGDWDLYTVDPGGSGTIRLTSGPGDDRYPAWSPDGKQIAFARFLNGQAALWVMAADGSTLRQVTDGFATDQDPAWLPDGSGLVFTSNRFEDDKLMGDVWIVRFDGTEPELLIREPNIHDGTPAMGGSGRVAYASERDRDARSIYILEGDRFTTNRLTFPGWLDREPVWSPDGITLVFTRSSIENPGDGDIWSVRTDDLTTKQRTTDEADEGQPAISPDGQSYTFQRFVDGSYHVMLADQGMAAEPDRVRFEDLSAGLGGNSLEPSWR
jgi:Tol biopolymer transport system component